MAESGDYTRTAYIRKIKELYQDNVYGYLPQRPTHLNVKTLTEDKRFAAGSAIRREMEFSLHFENRVFSFTATEVVPVSVAPVPVVIHISQFDTVPNEYLPAEEIADLGFAVISFSVKNICAPHGSKRDGIYPFIVKRSTRNAPGKLMLWAYAAMRIMDYVQSSTRFDRENVSVIGHRTLGIAASVAGIFDGRFKYVIVNQADVFNGAADFTAEADISEESARYTHLYCDAFADFDFTPLKKEMLSITPSQYLLMGRTDGEYRKNNTEDYTEHLDKNSVVDYNLKQELLNSKNVFCYKRNGVSYLSRKDWGIYLSRIKDIMESENEFRSNS